MDRELSWTSLDESLVGWTRNGTKEGLVENISRHTYVLKGQLKVRDGILNAGDYDYEPNGVLHGETEALEDTEYLFICDGPVLFFDDGTYPLPVMGGTGQNARCGSWLAPDQGREPLTRQDFNPVAIWVLDKR